MTMARAGIALGSNLGNRTAHLRMALSRLREIADPQEPLRISPIYQTEPMSCPPGSPDFLNAVVELAFTGTPHALLEKTRAIEKSLGRIRTGERNAPRVIDIDLLYFGDQQLDEADLTLPHPRIAERRFVLQPLADIRPDLVLPGETRPVATLLAQLTSDEAPLIRHAERIG